MGELLDKNKKLQKNVETQKQLTDDTRTNTNKKRKRKEVAIFGNYRNYYGYRMGEMEEDPRLKVMKKEWFEGKDCLDIGCNSGNVTITIARKFCCRSMLGVDIDSARVEDAHWTLRKIVNTITRKMHPAAVKISKEKANGLEKNITELPSECQSEKTNNSDPVQGKKLFDVVSFQKGNFVKSWQPPDNTSYHAIVCLSVTKWIHLNWGDDGLINLFSKAWGLLQPGGVFILEPQPWVSYVKNRLVSEAASSNYRNIQIGPEDFQDILLDKVGFRTVENLTPSLSGSKTGFDRPILAFWK